MANESIANEFDVSDDVLYIGGAVNYDVPAERRIGETFVGVDVKLDSGRTLFISETLLRHISKALEEGDLEL